MKNKAKISEQLLSLVRQLDQLKVQVNVGEFMAPIDEVQQLAKGTTWKDKVNAMVFDFKKLAEQKDKAVIPELKSKLKAIIDWLGSLEAQE